MPSVTRSLALTNSMSLPLLSFSPTWVADPSVDNCRTTAGGTIGKKKKMQDEHPGMVKSMRIEEDIFGTAGCDMGDAQLLNKRS